MLTIKLGEIKKRGDIGGEVEIYRGETKITRETEKAIEVFFIGTIEYWNWDVAEGDKIKLTSLDEESFEKNATVWLPKSVCNIYEDRIEVKEWAARKNGLLFLTEKEDDVVNLDEI